MSSSPMSSATRNGLDSLLRPRSIAIIGASAESLYAGRPLKNLLRFGYEGKIYPVNPKYSEVMGVKAYPSILDVPGDVDLAIYAISRDRIMSVLDQCAKKNVRAMLVVSAGFAESDAFGKELQNKLVEAARGYGIRICGPNCFGVASFRENMVASPEDLIRGLPPGPIGLISQSGALGFCTLLNSALDREACFSYVISTGNEADIELSECVQYLVDDPSTRVIALFVEGFRNPSGFLNAADKAIRDGKPIIALKVGRTDLGSRAALSHTGSMTGSDRVIDEVFRKKKIIRAEDIDELIQFAVFFSKAKRPRGGGLAVISSSGGLGSLSADLCGQLGLKLPELSGTTTERSLLELPELLVYGRVGNPADVRGQGIASLTKTIAPFLKDERFDIIVVACAHCGVGSVSRNVAYSMIDVQKTTDKTIVALWTGRKHPLPDESEDQIGYKILEKSDVSVFDSPRTCYRAIRALTERFQQLEPEAPPRRPSPTRVVPEKLDIGSGIVSYEKCCKLLDNFGIPMAAGGLAMSKADAVQLAESIGYPVAMKICSPQITHKTEANGVRLNLMSSKEVQSAYDHVLSSARLYNSKAEILGVIIQEMIHDGTETILGVTKDLQFGPVILFGLGGIFVEVISDTSIRVPPLSVEDARSMIDEVKGSKILRGFRQSAPKDIARLTEAILRVSDLSIAYADVISEFELNPLIVLDEGKGVKAVDVRLVTS